MERGSSNPPSVCYMLRGHLFIAGTAPDLDAVYNRTNKVALST